MAPTSGSINLDSHARGTLQSSSSSSSLNHLSSKISRVNSLSEVNILIWKEIVFKRCKEMMENETQTAITELGALGGFELREVCGRYDVFSFSLSLFHLSFPAL